MESRDIAEWDQAIAYLLEVGEITAKIYLKMVEMGVEPGHAKDLAGEIVVATLLMPK